MMECAKNSDNDIFCLVDQHQIAKVVHAFYGLLNYTEQNELNKFAP